MQPFILHYPVEQAHVERHNRDRRARLRHQSFVDRNVGSEPLCSEFFTQLKRCLLQILFRHADRAVEIDRMRDFRPDIGIGKREGSLRQHTGPGQLTNPLPPVLPAHNLYGGSLLLRSRGRHCHLRNTVCPQIQRFVCIFIPGCFQHRRVHRAVAIRAARRSQAVDYHVNRAEILSDLFYGLLLHLVRERICVDGFCIEAFVRGKLLECPRVVIARRGRPLFGSLLLKHNSERGRPAAECRADARSQPVACGSTDYKHSLRLSSLSVLRPARLYISSLAAHTFRAALRMRRDADKSFYLRFYNHSDSFSFEIFRRVSSSK